jgi:4-hydroxy-2-oxoglutarate aldolase
MDHRALVAHYTAVADASPIPVILYNVPASTGVDMTADTIIELAEHPNIIGLKESSGNVIKIGQIVGQTRDHFQTLAGSGNFLLPALSVGAVGGVTALSAIAAGALASMVASFQGNESGKARDIQLRLIPPNNAITSGFGIAGLKAAVDMVGMYGGPVRGPLLPLDDRQHDELRRILAEARII